MPIGVESAHGFGDLCFNLPLMEAIKHRYDDELWVATRQHCRDALYNIPWIDRIVDIRKMGEGQAKLRGLGCDPVFQITQNVRFCEFRERDLDHSLVDTPLLTGRHLGLPDFDQRPIFRPTVDELRNIQSMFSEEPTIALETVYGSGQSWATSEEFMAIVDKFADSHRILWLSHQGAPDHPKVDDLSRFTRREAIACLRVCEKFFSVGSGFFCAALGLPTHGQPDKIVCLWKDKLYRYEEPLRKHRWHPDITWIHNRRELTRYLRNL